MKTLLGLAAAVLLAPLLTLPGPAPASAEVSGNCSGQQIDSAPIRAGGRTYGTLFLHYDSSIGKNCAKATNTSGAARDMSLWLFRCAEGTGSTPATCRDLDQPTEDLNFDSGRFSSYAGPVYNKRSSAGLCIRAGVVMEVGGSYPDAEIGGHCG